jgi:signal recognition particle subunit SRP54
MPWGKSMFEALGERLERIFKNLRGQGAITERNIRDAMHDVRLALLEADVNFRVVKDFISRVTEKAIGREVLSSISPGQQIIKIVHDELINTMGGPAQPFSLQSSTVNVILLLGLQGSGKTTLAAKLAKRYMKHGWKPLLVPCDVYRPAAIHQLKVVGNQVGVPTYDQGNQKKPALIAANALEFARTEGRDLVIIDTAGRLHINEVLMDELVEIKKAIHPQFTLLVADAMTGQDAVNSASAFNEQVGIDGVCLTKLDGDARGGAALSIKAVTGKPIVFVGVGEKLGDLEEFHAERLASRILGMGDVLTLVEKAQVAFDEKKAREMERKIRKQSFTLQDFLEQMQQVRKMGSLKDLIAMIPGLGRQVKDVELDDRAFASIEAMILSMTPEEREQPEVLNGSRRRRIAQGSGNSVQDINQLLKQFDETKRMMKQVLRGGGPGVGPFRKKKVRHH